MQPDTSAQLHSPHTLRATALFTLPLLLAYTLLLILGAMTFHSPAAMPRGNEMGWDRAVFAAVNAATLTGFQPFVTPAQYLWLGQFASFALILAGILFLMIVGGLLASRALQLRYGPPQIIGFSITCIAVATFLGALFLSVPGQPLAGVFTGAAAFGNCGLLISPAPSLTSWQTQLIILPLAVCGGLGLPVLMQTAGWLGGRNPLDHHTRIVFTWSAAIYLLAVALFLAIRYLDPAANAPSDNLRTSLAAASAASLNTRTLGLPLPFTSLFPSVAMQWIALPLMLIGASPAGTAGGLKTTTLHSLFTGIGRAFVGKAPGRLFAIAVLWLLTYALIAFACLIALLITQPQLAPDRLLFITISALSNVGLAKDAISITGIGLYILSAAMLLGRLLPLAILAWTAYAVKNPDVLVG